MQIKTASILLLTHYHFFLGKHLRLFAKGENKKSSKFFRIINEIPTVLLIVIVLLFLSLYKGVEIFKKKHIFTSLTYLSKKNHMNLQELKLKKISRAY